MRKNDTAEVQKTRKGFHFFVRLHAVVGLKIIWLDAGLIYGLSYKDGYSVLQELNFKTAWGYVRENGLGPLLWMLCTMRFFSGLQVLVIAFF